MTQHVLAEHMEEDVTTMKNLRNFVSAFVAFAVVLAVGVAIFAP